MPGRSVLGLGLGLALALGGCGKHGAAVERAEPGQDAEAGQVGEGPSGVGAAAPSCAPPSGLWYLHLSDVHLGASVEAQAPGGDTSAPLWAATKAALAERIGGPNPPAFILYTGDLPDHTPDRGELHTANISAVLSDLKALAGDIPLLYLPGNNDSLDWDYASFTSTAGQTPLSAAGWPGPTLGLEPEPGGDPAQGYYSAVPLPGLRVVALNTVLMSASYPCAHQRDTAGACRDDQAAQVEAELSWLEAELERAAAASEAVLLAMHIPPGVDAYKSPKLMWKEAAWEDRFVALLDASPAPLAGLAYGHTHLDELRRVQTEAGELAVLGLSAPGITPGHGNNPGFKAISLAPGSFLATEALTWYARAADPAAPVYAYADDGCYRYSEVFGCAPGPLAACLAGPDACAIAAQMDTIYTVDNGAPSYATASAIDVRPGRPAPPSCEGS